MISRGGLDFPGLRLQLPLTTTTKSLYYADGTVLTVLFQIEGTFQLYSPPVLLSYDRETHCRQYGTLFSDTSRLRDSTFLTVFITVHPPLHHPEPFKVKFRFS